jgi:hypothetical protein
LAKGNHNPTGSGLLVRSQSKQEGQISSFSSKGKGVACSTTKKNATMMSSVALSKIRPSVQRLATTHGLRSMTILSKQSGEEYKKMVRVVHYSEYTL